MICKSEFEVLKFDIKHNIEFILKLNLFKGDFSFNYMFCINAINILTPLENCNVHSQVPKRTKERREEGGEGGGRGKREGGEGSGDGINEKLKFQQSLLSSPLLTTDPSYVLHDKSM